MDHLEEEIEIEAIGVEVSTQPVELYKVLKIADAVGGGGEAKQAISQGFVAVNGEIETRKRRKLVDGDLVQFDEEFYLVIYVDPADVVETEDVNMDYDAGDQGFDEPEYAESQYVESKYVEPQFDVQDSEPAQVDSDEDKNPKTGRKSISFF